MAAMFCVTSQHCLLSSDVVHYVAVLVSH